MPLGIFVKRNCSPTFNQHQVRTLIKTAEFKASKQYASLSELKSLGFIEIATNKENQKRARRAVLCVGAVLPPLAVCVVEKIAFNTSYFAAMLGNRFSGRAEPVADGGPVGLTTYSWVHTSGNILSSPGLWIGLGVTAAFLAAAVQLRRYHGPI